MSAIPHAETRRPRRALFSAFAFVIGGGAVAPLQAASPLEGAAVESSCAVPVLPGPPRLASLPKEYGRPPFLDRLNDSILRHYQAARREHEAVDGILEAVRSNGCGPIQNAFARFAEAFDAAFEKRVKEDVRPWGADAVRWTPAAHADRAVTSAPDAYVYLDLDKACRAPSPHNPLDYPEAPDNAGEPEKATLQRLAADTKTYNAMTARQLAALSDLLSLERAFDCREVITAYGSLLQAESDAFLQRRDGALASLVEPTLKWERSP